MSLQRVQIDFMASPSDLQYFFETASVLNFSRAAERLSIAQPSLSLAMQRLEGSIGAPLFTRHKRGVTLTPAGKRLLAHTRSLLEHWEDVKGKTISSVREIQGRFTLGCHPSVALMLLHHFLPELLKNPDLEIHLVHDMSKQITEQVIDSIIDIGLVVNPVKHPDLIITKFYDDEVAFWQSEGLAKNKTYAGKHATIIYDSSRLPPQLLHKKAKAAGINVVRTIESKNLEVVASLVAGGCGIGILPTRVAQLAPKKLVRWGTTPIFRDEICLIIRVESKKVASIQHICQLIRDNVR